MVPLINLGAEEFVVEHGLRIAQLVIAPFHQPIFTWSMTWKTRHAVMAVLVHRALVTNGSPPFADDHLLAQLPDAALDRFARHLVMPTLGPKGQQALLQARVAIVG